MDSLARVALILAIVSVVVVAGGVETVLDFEIRDGWGALGVRGTGARLWPGAQLLSTYIAENPSCISGLRVAELGCASQPVPPVPPTCQHGPADRGGVAGGLGLCSLAAVRSGAAYVLATDGEPSVLELARKNLRANLSQEELARCAPRAAPASRPRRAHAHPPRPPLPPDPLRARARTCTALLAFGERHAHGTFDSVLASDLVYSAAGHHGGFCALIDALLSLTAPGSAALLAYAPRFRRERAFWALLRGHFAVWLLRRAAAPPRADGARSGAVFLLRLTRRAPRAPRPALRSRACDARGGDAAPVGGNEGAGGDAPGAGPSGAEFSGAEFSELWSSEDSLAALVSVEDLVNPLGAAPRRV